jgi:hypothetical protein
MYRFVEELTMIRFFPLAVSSKVQCTSHNESDRFQIIRVIEEGQWLERTLAAGQRLKFEAYRNSYVDIYIADMAMMVLSDRLSCEGLID